MHLPSVPWQLTGNHWLTLPCINPTDGAIHALGVLHRGARAAIEFLRKKGWQPEVLVPWEAEIAFLERDWPKLSTTLQQLELTGTTPGVLRGATDFWLLPAKG